VLVSLLWLYDIVLIALLLKKCVLVGDEFAVFGTVLLGLLVVSNELSLLLIFNLVLSLVSVISINAFDAFNPVVYYLLIIT
jgi:hypothetical protein